ncbi:MAG: creatininase family protein [Gammaproteobacteria bacterium]
MRSPCCPWRRGQGHGYHLPLNTDFLQASWIAGEVERAVNAVVWPVLSYGYYPVFIDYPGSISLSRDNFFAVVIDVMQGIARAGARDLVILNTGISTIEPLHEAIRHRTESLAVALINVYSGERFAATAAAVEQQPFGGHADEIETSIMLALAPERVRMARAERQPTHIARGLFNRRDPNAANYSPSGANGDPTLATAEKGRRLLQAMREDVLNAIGLLRTTC